MIEYSNKPIETKKVEGTPVNVFTIGANNIDEKTVVSFGEEWSKFNYFNDEEIRNAGDQYFDIVHEDYFRDKLVLDMGCGTGRWTKYIVERAKHIDAVDPSNAIFVAAKMLNQYANVRLSKASVDSLPFADGSFDFVFSLGVLHHIPDTPKAMDSCVKKLKPGGHFLVYLYYSLDNRGPVFKSVFHFSNLIRRIVSRMPTNTKRFTCDLLAVFVYMPFVLLSKFFAFAGLKRFVRYIPLSYYSNKSFNIIRNDALDRFGTPLEQRFSKAEIQKMMEDCGLTEIVFSKGEPYWHAIGKKK